MVAAKRVEAMTAGRETILGNIRKSLNRGPLAAERAAELERRLKAAEPNLVPARGAVEGAERIALFIAEAEKVDTSVSRVADAADVPGAVAAYLAAHNLPTVLKAAPDPALADIPWSHQTALTVSEGRAEDGDEVSVTGAFAGIAETGTLMLESGPHSPTTLNFLPDTHVVVIEASAIDGTYEEAWSRLRASAGEGAGAAFMPRAINLITGPSRTADIEQTLLLGAHGPRRQLIVIIDGEGP
jgi:L-lactate dehydrogenase complex protein LldG